MHCFILIITLPMISKIKAELEQFWSTKGGAWLKRLLLKVILTNREKYFFDLLAPISPLRSKAPTGYLHQWQWSKSSRIEFPLTDVDGNYLPWFTFPLTAFLSTRIVAGTRVLEMGAGSSTLWFLSMGCQLYTLEHDESWTQKVSSQVKNTLIIQTISYWAMDAAEFPSGPFDIIVVDGRKRVLCVEKTLSSLGPDGVVILDDSERLKYQQARQFLYDNGFRELEFHGLRHQSTLSSCTSLFYRTNNCLNV